MGLFGKKQTDDCEDLGEALAQTNSGRREVEWLSETMENWKR